MTGGTDWGMTGHVKVAKDQNDHCGVTIGAPLAPYVDKVGLD